jgi:putative sigma-54 modulation protein
MTIDVHFKQMEASDSLRDYTSEKSEKLKKYFDGKVHATWNFRKEHGEFISHCHVLGNHIDLFGEGIAEEAYATVDLAIAKIEKQLRRHKELVKDHHRTETVKISTTGDSSSA